MTKEIYNTVKDYLGSIVDTNGNTLYKTIELWNNQVEHELANQNDEQVYQKPACFIEFTNIMPQNLGKKAEVQGIEFDMVLHLVFPYMLKEQALDVLAAKQITYKAVQIIEFGTTEPTCSRFTRSGEIQQYDSSLLYIFEQTYHARYNDFSAIPSQSSGTVGLGLTITYVNSL